MIVMFSIVYVCVCVCGWVYVYVKACLGLDTCHAKHTYPSSAVKPHVKFISNPI